ncbi:MAG: hypothetical protein HQ518_09920 [Rhodopirellula sp.]|nr:hypothetical protein [Rhodopirellula sp.]
MSHSSKTIIYDFGANNGDDIPYYLMKADLVVAVEANPILCDVIQTRFALEIRDGKLALEGCVVTSDECFSGVSFFIHKTKHVLSQFPRPHEEQIGEFEEVHLPLRSIMSIILQYGSPYYIKLDIEHYDAELLKALFRNNVFPLYISAESHHIDVFCRLVSEGNYNAFKLLVGPSVSAKYVNVEIANKHGESSVRYSFPDHSAGPFGNDIKGPWMNADAFSRLLVLEGMGWKDIHASRVDPFDPTARVSISMYALKRVLRRAVRGIKKGLRW